jgi:hypothetical protein
MKTAIPQRFSRILQDQARINRIRYCEKLKYHIIFI